MFRWLITVSVLISAAVLAPLTDVRVPADVSNNQVELEFPDRLTFSADFKSDTPIERVVLEYGVDQMTCGTVVAKAFPEYTPGQTVNASWTWEMKQTGSQPPGAQIWWRWRLTDTQGTETVSEQQTVTWLDDQHAWQTISGGDIDLHWYDNAQSFGRDLHDSAVQSLADLAEQTGLRTDKPIDLYIYADTQDMQDAILYEPGWTGGLAFQEYNIVLIGIAPEQIDWGKRTQAHELTHVLVGQLTYSCLSDIPTWLQEGLAVYGEGGPEPDSVRQLERAIKDNTVLSIRSLSGNFSEDPAKADISYSQSYSVVSFLIEQYGQDKMQTLLEKLRDGATVDEALQATYGFDVDGFEDAWRAEVGAKPRTTSTTKSTATPPPTAVPTFVPVSSVQEVPTMSPTRERPTPTPISVAKAPAATSAAEAPASSSAETTTAESSIPLIAIIIAAIILLVGFGLILFNRGRQRMQP